MTPQEISQIRTNINQIRALNVPELLAKQFPAVDLAEHRFSNLTASQLITLMERVLTQYSDALDTPDAALLCKGFYWETAQQGMAHRHIVTVVQQLATYLSNKQWDAASQHLELAIGYLMQIGYWDRSSRKLQSVGKLRLSDLFQDLNTKVAQFREILVLCNNMSAEQKQAVAKRDADAAAVSGQLAQAQKQATAISDLVAKSTGQNGQLVQILTTQEANLAKTETELKAIAEGRTQLAGALKTASEKLTSSDERLKFMEEKAEWVNELAGTAAAGVLGQKFEARMRQLATASNWWLGGTIGSVILGAGWIGISHKYFMRSGGDVWLTLALNFGLLLPALFLVGFFAKQFGKVRQFEEEYAFRSSVAMTLSAFADRLAGDDNERNRLITDTVEKLYRLPVLLQEREPSGWFSQRSTERMVKATTELVAAVKQPPA